jgi:hypothetical protein
VAALDTSADLLFGERQLEQFLEDRIEQNRVIVSPEFYNWIKRAFANGNRGRSVSWRMRL